MTQNLIETLKTFMYSPKHTQNTQIHCHFQIFKKSEIHIFKYFKFKQISVLS